MGQNIIIFLTDWSEEDERGDVGERGERRLCHCSSVVGESGWEWVGEKATEMGFC